MSDILSKSTVLVLNRNWQPIGVRTPADAFCQMATGVARGLDIEAGALTPVNWQEWTALPVRPDDQAARTPRGLVRVPTVIVLGKFGKVPIRRLAFSARALWERDEGRCQYTGRELRPGEGNIDHVVPRSRGGATSWENCVLADKDVNSRKADRLPHEVGLRLIRRPVKPPEVPVTLLIRNQHGIADWKFFLP